MKYFYLTMIEHYQERINDKAIPLLVRGQFKITIQYYQHELEKLTLTEFNHLQKLLPCL